VAAAKSRTDARTAEIDRLETQVQDARSRANDALAKFKALEAQVAGLDEGEFGLDADHEAAEDALAAADQVVADLRAEEQRVDRERAAASATVQALAMSLERRDGVADLIESGIAGVLGPVSGVVQVEPGFEAAAAAALGPLAEALAVDSIESAVEALSRLRAHDSGAVHMLVAGAPSDGWQGELPYGARWAADLLRADETILSSLRRALAGIVVVDDLTRAAEVARQDARLVAVTRSGEVLGASVARGGSGVPSRLEVQAALDEATRALDAATSRGESIRFELVTATAEQERTLSKVEAALEQLHESDARLAAVAEQLAQLGQVTRAAQAEADRFVSAQQAAIQTRDADLVTLNDLQVRLNAAEAEPDDSNVDPAERAALAASAEAAAQQEVESRLSLRTLEGRLQSVAERADRAERAAAAERSARERAAALRDRRIREAQVAAAVLAGADIVLERLAASLAEADSQRTRGEAARAARESELTAIRGQLRELATELERLVDSVHRDEVARAEQRLRIEQLEERAVADLGIEPDVLVAEYGPDQLVPPSIEPDADAAAPVADSVPYDRIAQERRLASAEKQLNLLGKINPLALEEFDALEERHRFLTEQLDDLKRSRADLLEVVREVDERVQQVFGEAYEDVQREFKAVFARLFPGGEGQLILTDPDNLLGTGVDIEARPPGKKVKRLSLLSGGERSLTAVAFLVALFKARPNPFYILDEVEAALDDTNLGRLLEIYEELRENSQLLVVTHQKRTMEVADALYGISMRGDGISAVVSQRLRERDTA
jgi:chromosome segregation protein